ncbi:DUF7848 domain-containing protein [Streptomyces rimosus]|uniref:DUF7848 domain-containing protein n=1 Tax=Streptomyces rimosus TaxID=1927 RepID=UPI0037AE9E84
MTESLSLLGQAASPTPQLLGVLGEPYETVCTAAGCDAESGPQEDQDSAQQWALRHSGRTGHGLFRRVVSDHARVTRSE